MDTPSPSPGKKHIPLSDLLKERARITAEQKQEMAPAGKSWEERQREFALKAWVENRHVVTPKQQYAREQTLADWLEVPLPIDEKRGIRSAEDILMQLIPRLKISSESMQTEQMAEGWRRAAGDFIAHNAQLVKVDRGTAVIKVIQPALRYQLNQMKAPLLEKLQKEFPSCKIEQIRFIYG